MCALAAHFGVFVAECFSVYCTSVSSVDTCEFCIKFFRENFQCLCCKSFSLIRFSEANAFFLPVWHILSPFHWHFCCTWPPPAGIELEKIGFGAFFALELHEKDGELRCSFKGFLLVHVGAVYARGYTLK